MVVSHIFLVTSLTNLYQEKVGPEVRPFSQVGGYIFTHVCAHDYPIIRALYAGGEHDLHLSVSHLLCLLYDLMQCRSGIRVSVHSPALYEQQLCTLYHLQSSCMQGDEALKEGIGMLYFYGQLGSK